MSGKGGKLAHLSLALAYRRGDADRLDPDTQPLESPARRWSHERVGEDKVGRESQHFLDRSGRSPKAARLRQRHRRGARVVAVMRNRQHLPRLRHRGEDRVGTGVEADDRGVGRIRLALGHRRATGKYQGRQNPPRHGEGDHPQDGGGGSPQALRQAASPLRQRCALPPPRAGEDHLRRTPTNAPRPGEA